MLVFDNCLKLILTFILCNESGFIRGPGNNPKPLAFSFHDKFKQGPLLSVVSLFFFFFFIKLYLNFMQANLIRLTQILLQWCCQYYLIPPLCSIYTNLNSNAVLEQWILLYLSSYISIKCSTIVEVLLLPNSLYADFHLYWSLKNIDFCYCRLEKASKPADQFTFWFRSS